MFNLVSLHGTHLFVCGSAPEVSFQRAGTDCVLFWKFPNPELSPWRFCTRPQPPPQHEAKQSPAERCPWDLIRAPVPQLRLPGAASDTRRLALVTESRLPVAFSLVSFSKDMGKSWNRPGLDRRSYGSGGL